MAGKLRLEYMSPDKLKDHPQNWRIHADDQMRALDDSIESVGWAGAVLVNEKTGHILNGHARKKIAIRREEKVPVLVGSWTEAEELELLATLDPIGSMAHTNRQKFADLAAKVKLESDDLNKLLAKMAGDLSEATERLSATTKSAPDDPLDNVEKPKTRKKSTPPPDDARDESGPPTMRVTQLFLNEDNLKEYAEMVTALAPRYGTDNATDTVLACLREAYRNLK